MTTYKYIISPTAADNLNAIGDYLCNNLHNPKAAKDFISEFKKIIDTVCTMPNSSALCRKSSLRKLGIRFVMVKSYKVYYSVNNANKNIEILFIRHKLQNT